MGIGLCLREFGLPDDMEVELALNMVDVDML